MGGRTTCLGERVRARKGINSGKLGGEKECQIKKKYETFFTHA